jgi:hypothetical protein
MFHHKFLSSPTCDPQGKYLTQLVTRIISVTQFNKHNIRGLQNDMATLINSNKTNVFANIGVLVFLNPPPLTQLSIHVATSAVTRGSP